MTTVYPLFHTLQLVTERVLIAPLQDSDLAAVYEMHCTNEVNKYIPYSTWHGWQDAEQWLDMMHQRRVEEEAQIFSLKRKIDDAFIGTSLVFNANKSAKDLNIGYVLKAQYWGQGYASEAIHALTDGLLSMNGIPQLKATVQEGNAASVSVLLKLGFNEVAIDVDDRGLPIRRYEKHAGIPL